MISLLDFVAVANRTQGVNNCLPLGNSMNRPLHWRRDEETDERACNEIKQAQAHISWQADSNKDP